MGENKSDRKWIPVTEVHVYVYKDILKALPRGSGWFMQTIRNPQIPDNARDRSNVAINEVKMISVFDQMLVALVKLEKVVGQVSSLLTRKWGKSQIQAGDRAIKAGKGRVEDCIRCAGFTLFMWEWNSQISNITSEPYFMSVWTGRLSFHHLSVMLPGGGMWAFFPPCSPGCVATEAPLVHQSKPTYLHLVCKPVCAYAQYFCMHSASPALKKVWMHLETWK